MNARGFLDRSGTHTFGPETMKVLYQSFDDAWAIIADRYSDQKAADDARLKLAEAMLAVVRSDSRDPEQLTRLGLEMFRIMN
jgi:hypothetical protein